MRTVKLIFSLASALLLTAAICSFCKFDNECETLRDKVFRVHILANSDSEQDQALKLKVRDEMVKYADLKFSGCADKYEAEATTFGLLSEIEEIANEVISENGYEYDVRAYMTNMFFETRDYDTFTMPAGFYDALRIEIGEAKGKNWWCVLFPQLCVPAAIKKPVSEKISSEPVIVKTQKEPETEYSAEKIGIEKQNQNSDCIVQTKISDCNEQNAKPQIAECVSAQKSLTKAEISVITQPVKYKISFKAVEIFQKLKKFFGRK